MPTCLAVALGTVGCGGQKPLTRAEYVKQADAICKDFSARQKKLGTPKSVKDIERLAAKSRPLVVQQLGQLRDLKAPDEIAGDVNGAYDLLEQQLPQIDELGKAAKANDVPKIQRIATAAGKLDRRANAKASAAGLKVCGAAR